MPIKQQSYCFLLVAFFVLSLALSSCSKDTASKERKPIVEQGDITSQLKLLGNPLKTKYNDNTPRVYARNVWDMHAYNGKIYFGGGNSSNAAPAANAGKAELWSFDVTSQNFIKEFTVDDEQIHLIREFDNQLYIPGHDASESWDFGNFYRLENSIWKKYRTIPNAIHVYDIYKWGNRLFASIGPQKTSRSIMVSDDGGNTWYNSYCTYTTVNGDIKEVAFQSRIYNIFPLSNKLYALPMVYSGSGNAFTWLTGNNPLYAGEKGATRIERSVVFDNQTAYILGKTYNDHQYLPVALCRAKDSQNVSRIALAEGVLPRDILLKEGYLVVLVSKLNPDNTYSNMVLLTSDISSEFVEWKELFRFTAGTFARSFEYLNGVFYFGLGCETEEPLSPETGNILSFEYSL